MRILYGSQNFGYDTPDSDKDYMEIVFPTLEDIVRGRTSNRETKQLDGSIVKVKDIRLLPKMLLKGNFNDLQILYSKEYEDCKGLEWFIENRERIVRYSPSRLVWTNAGYIKQCIKYGTYHLGKLVGKDYARAICFTHLIERALTTDKLVFCDESLRDVRSNKHRYNDAYIENKLIELERLASTMIETDITLEQEMYNEIQKLIVERLKHDIRV